MDNYTKMHTNIHDGLEQRLGYVFNDPRLLAEALTHKSYAHEKQLSNTIGNERLEFLGDAVLELIVSHSLVRRYPDFPEGRLSKIRAAIVNTDALATVARALDLGRHVLLSKGESENHGREKKSILANVYEAMLAAVFLDGGFAAVVQLVERQFAPAIERAAEKGFEKDYKSRLQELAQKRFNVVPTYAVLKEAGPDHSKQFVSQVIIQDRIYETGQGCNKKSAEQQAAKKTIARLEREQV